MRPDLAAPPATENWDIAVAESFNDGTKAGAQTATSYLFVADLTPIAQVYDD
ncbi:hypothetical protein [Cupriavidus oxalaticus]|uniref:hypothetical protein n=1 Tax=Cupriavidus oxalaticus TaxID=96344 RepID=UPI00142F1EAD|nr:hypothetical protein [Cupriavidus oxalaticus]